METNLEEEIDLLDQHRRTTKLVLANLAAAQERLTLLPAGPTRSQLIALQDEMIDAATRSLKITEPALEHLQSVEALYVGSA